MKNKQTVLRQIDDIYEILQNNVKALISGLLMIAVGIGIMAIPFIELLFSHTLNPLLSHCGGFSEPIIFMAHTIFYWTLFAGIGIYFNSGQRENEIIKKVFDVGKMLPVICLSVAAALSVSGNYDLIAPFIITLVGCFFMFYGQFTDFIVRLIAGILLLIGLVGILLIPYHIPHLWMYLVFCEGLAFFIMGLMLYRSQHKNI